MLHLQAIVFDCSHTKCTVSRMCNKRRSLFFFFFLPFLPVKLDGAAALKLARGMILAIQSLAGRKESTLRSTRWRQRDKNFS